MGRRGHADFCPASLHWTAAPRKPPAGPRPVPPQEFAPDSVFGGRTDARNGFGKSTVPPRSESGGVMQTIETPTSNSTSATEPCPLCGTALPRGANECTRCDWVRQPPGLAPRKKNPRDVAALCLSVVPGAGHFFKGYDKLAILFFAGIPVIALLAYAFTMFFGWFLLPAYWIAVAADAYLRKDIRPPTPGTPLKHTPKSD